MNRIGILGGTFDPPHLAHFIIAESARDELRLDKVLWVVAADPPHKREIILSPIQHRLAMIRLALKGQPMFELSLLDIERDGPHYTVDMLSLAASAHPGDQLFFLMGSDSLRDLPTWRDPGKLTEHAAICVVRRPDVSDSLNDLFAVVPQLEGQIVFLNAPLVDISSTMIRERVQQGRTIRYLLPERVESYIHKHHLYG